MLPILLTGDSYIASYNSPHYSRYHLTHNSSLEKNEPDQIFSVWQPEWLRYQLIHTFGTVTYTDQPWIYTFEARQSQILALQRDPKLLTKTRQCLAQNSCKKIIFTSHYAQQQFIHLHQDWTGLDQLKNKLEIVYPSLPEFKLHAKSILNHDNYLHIILAESSFNSCGGILALRLAHQAKKNGFPLKIHIVYSLDLDNNKRDVTHFDPYKKYSEALDLDNIIYHSHLSNQQDILQLLSECHFQLIAPLVAELDHYQMLAGFAVGTPAITTNIGVLPEFNHDAETGYLLNLEVDELTQQWKGLKPLLSETQNKWKLISPVYDHLAQQTFQILTKFWQKKNRRHHHQQLRYCALEQLKHYHCAEKINETLDHLYASSIELDFPNISVKNDPLVSIIIPVYNGEQYIEEALDSIFNQTYQNYEIITVDDGSTDNSHNILKSYKHHIRYIYQENRGVSTARNHGITEAKGEFIAFLDADDFFILTTKLEEEVAFFQADPSLGLVKSGWCQVNQKGEKIVDELCWLDVPQLELATWVHYKHVFPSAMVCRRDWLTRIGGFNTRFTHSEDMDIVLRLLALGCEGRWLKKIAVAYRQSEGSASSQSRKVAQGVEKVISNFFNLPGLPSNIYEKKSLVLYYDLLWVAWQLYHDQDFSGMAEYLQKSFSISPYPPSETIYRCIAQFDLLNQKYTNTRINPFELTYLPEWQQAIKFLVPEGDTYSLWEFL
jgi:glycosyltransferase involved in cell wall biosynthesis